MDLGGWRQRDMLNLAAGCIVIICMLYAKSEAAVPLGPSDRPEAYFNGSSYIRLSRPISLKQLVGLSYRTCVGGELFSQRSEGYTLHVTALYEQVVVSWSRPGQPQREVGMAKETLDNRWHWVALRYRPNPPALLLEVDKETQVISNVTWNGELLSAGALEANGAVVLVGNVFSGCLHEGPQLEFHAAYLLQTNVRFGQCPLTTDECKDRKDVLRIPPKDHCYNEPCLRHGTCISRHDRYECHCSARYTGNNCEVDAGDPCASSPCHHGGTCEEDVWGDYTCLCPKHYHGIYCELEDSLDPQCVAGPCRNNGSCSVPSGADIYVCDCPPGYTGRNCETDIDECAMSGVACLNGGRCVDAVNNYTCDCTNTGYTGPRCESNVNECLEERSVCGHGVCYDTYGSFVCACLPGYTGDRCQKMSACASGPCGAGGACVEENNGAGFRCVCARGLAPPLCVPIQASPTTLSPSSSPAPSLSSVAPPTAAACEDISCPPKSHCRQGVTGLVAGIVLTKQVLCVCDVGYYGAPGISPNCSSLDSVCENGVCQNGGTCTRTPEYFNCTCPPPYRGVYCEVGPSGKALSEPKVERCASLPCLHSTGCRDTSNGFRCECEAGWTGARCEVNTGNAVGDCGRGCANGGTCRGAECECRPGFGGPFCETTLDCRATPCPHRQECVEQSGTWRCAAASPESACASSPCHNGTCLALDNGLFRCQCQPGHTGRFCEIDIDECALMPKICNHGVCVNVPGSYQCYCKPGYTGDSCEQDIDECLSSPCKNGGTCQNLENNYECTCVEGFEGKDCSININECATDPCAAGATCVDGIASYSCLCPEGLTGARCQIDIDDCESEPCLHGGHCSDGVNSFTCDCTGTGYNGPTCEANIDECAPQPCRNAATCMDDLNDYHCVCHQGFTGKNCEIDIEECESNPCKYDGVCLERSNISLYRTSDSPPVQVGPQPHMLLPQVFYQPFSLENAGGFECVCVSGTTGPRCEINIDECESSPCGHGKCVDGIGVYRCECAPGYEGDHCEIEIDECLRYAPCAHGRCYDGHASYMCLCESGWGGRNCSVVLRGCADSPCANRGNCLPWLANETDHRFNCSCAPGFYGTTCEKITTMSLEKSSFVEVNTSREEGYDISFRFKTTLGNGLLAMGRGLTYFFLELSNGRLNLHSSLLNKWEGVFIGSNLNDSSWQKVFVTINSSHVVLSANEEQTIYPISQNEAFNATVTSFPSTRLGTAGSSYATLTHGPNFFVGCFQDVVVNQHWVIPEDSNTTVPEYSTERVGSDWGEETETEVEPESPEDEGPRVVLRGVLASCPRTPQCEPNPCHSGGHCEDAWTTFVCSCPRPYLGHTCQYNYTAATFGQESAQRHSVVVVSVSEVARRAVHAALDISMFVRTRKPTGQIFYLGSGSSRFGGTDETLVAASLKGGELLVHLRFNNTPEDYTVGGTRLDNGHLHLIQVVRNSTLVQVKLNGTEYFRKSISAAKQLDAQVLYLGGPPAPIMPTESTLLPNTTQAPITEPADAEYFKGVIQDVQISNGLNVTIVEFFPLRVEGVSLPPPFGEVELDPSGVLEGVVSDDVCASYPCHHNATCTNTWNDYTCSCPRGYKGKQCDEVEFCQLQGCPLNSHCRNLDRGYECVSNATFDGVNTTLTYTLRTPAADALAEPVDAPHMLTLTYRSKVGGTLFRAELDESEHESDSEKNTTNAGISWFSVGVYRGQAALQWRLGGLPALRTLRTRTDGLHWTTLRLTFVDQQINGAFVDADGHEEVTLTDNIDVGAWQRLVTRGVITLGGVGHAKTRPHPTATTFTVDNTTEAVWEYSEGDDFDDNLNGEYFKGCLGAVHVGGLLLPYFTEEELFVGAAAALLAAQPHYALMSGSPWGWSEGVGCVLCLEQECQRGAHCEDVRNSYSCACPPGYEGDYCQIDIDECENNQCQNGATCKDDVAKYLCLCPNGYDGVFCEHDIDECESSPCAHGGRCIDLPGAFQCECGTEWTGPQCLRPKHRSCAHAPCTHRAKCTDVYDASSGNNYTCTCEEGWMGVHCEQAFCEIERCEHGVCNTTTSPPSCWCEEGFAGRRCEREVDVCASGYTCEHNARCRTSNGRALCDCPPEWRGAHCEIDVDECLERRVDCGPGVCRNLPGSYTCECEAGLCGDGCVLSDPCLEVREQSGANGTGPCLNGGQCTQRCTNVTDYICDCTHPATGKNCAQLLTSEDNGGSDTTTILLSVGGALLGALVLGGAIAVLAAQARRKRATRGTYSPSGQEYCNPRAEMMHNALKPPPEERLI